MILHPDVHLIFSGCYLSMILVYHIHTTKNVISQTVIVKKPLTTKCFIRNVICLHVVNFLTNVIYNNIPSYRDLFLFFLNRYCTKSKS